MGAKISVLGLNMSFSQYLQSAMVRFPLGYYYSDHAYLIILLHKVEAAIVGHEGGDLLAVLDQLDTDALSDGGVRLLGLYSHLLQHDSLAKLLIIDY